MFRKYGQWAQYVIRLLGNNSRRSCTRNVHFTSTRSACDLSYRSNKQTDAWIYPLFFFSPSTTNAENLSTVFCDIRMYISISPSTGELDGFIASLKAFAFFTAWKNLTAPDVRANRCYFHARNRFFSGRLNGGRKSYNYANLRFLPRVSRHTGRRRLSIYRLRGISEMVSAS